MNKKIDIFENKFSNLFDFEILLKREANFCKYKILNLCRYKNEKGSIESSEVYVNMHKIEFFLE